MRARGYWESDDHAANEGCVHQMHSRLWKEKQQQAKSPNESVTSVPRAFECQNGHDVHDVPAGNLALYSIDPP